jgi:hypothetical protein
LRTGGIVCGCPIGAMGRDLKLQLVAWLQPGAAKAPRTALMGATSVTPSGLLSRADGGDRAHAAGNRGLGTRPDK